MHDLSYLAQYDPECFEKTCKNVVYNIPEAKPIMLPESPESVTDPELSRIPGALQTLETLQGQEQVTELPEWQSIAQVLENLKHLEMEEFPVADIDADRVKSLLGNLYMELLFPHNDDYPFMMMTGEVNEPTFDRRA